MAPDEEKDGWAVPEPRYLPGPSFWPAGLALGIVLFVISPAFEYVVSWVFLTSGLLLMAFSLRGWIMQIRDDVRSRDE